MRSSVAYTFEFIRYVCIAIYTYKILKILKIDQYMRKIYKFDNFHIKEICEPQTSERRNPYNNNINLQYNLNFKRIQMCNKKYHCKKCHIIPETNEHLNVETQIKDKNFVNYKCDRCNKNIYSVYLQNKINSKKFNRIIMDVKRSSALKYKYPYDFLDVCLEDSDSSFTYIYESFDTTFQKDENFSFSPKQLVSILKKINLCHSTKIVHGNIRPENILKRNDKYFIINYENSCDLSQIFDKNDNPRPRVSNCNYTPPEYLLSSAEIYFDTDYWAFATLVYYTAEKKYPFDIQNDYIKFLKEKSYMDRKELIEKLYPRDSITFNNIKDKKLQDLIKQMLMYDRSERLGIGPGGFKNIIKHDFFEKTKTNKKS
ncbi:Protein kinase [Spraguea lophii 42_110]|uniref:non-specific serine/threonine protein kinase n=1 Tax=Spraguea lophii (strain 42_110) TaxID=1358809 RepID=S7XLH7_SPRLO|nr:Protein kinase [Spraguea lophii 42_110]